MISLLDGSFKGLCFNTELSNLWIIIFPSLTVMVDITICLIYKVQIKFKKALEIKYYQNLIVFGVSYISI